MYILMIIIITTITIYLLMSPRSCMKALLNVNVKLITNNKLMRTKDKR